MRVRRLLAEAEQMGKAFEKSELIKVTPGAGNPPDTYKIEYSIKSLERDAKGKPVPRESHLVEIHLTSDYPRLSPQCKMLSPIFHPNIDTTTICVGDHWTAGERLVDLVIRIGEMLAYQAYNIKSPLDGEAAMWADLNPSQLPTDSRNIRPGGME
jgi:ubiquitin-protein ligase